MTMWSVKHVTCEKPMIMMISLHSCASAQLFSTFKVTGNIQEHFHSRNFSHSHFISLSGTFVQLFPGWVPKTLSTAYTCRELLVSH